MAAGSKIEWTEATWNPATGCTKHSPGCQHCYAERMARRLRAMGVAKYAGGFEPTVHPEALPLPLTWKSPKMVFVNSMSDLFHERIPDGFVREVFQVMHRAEWHTFQVLTKRSDRLAHLGAHLDWPPNVWIGVSVETADYVRRIDDLRQTPAQCRFLSLEPLLGPLPTLDLRGIDWVIVGGESGPGARPMAVEWVRRVRDQCVECHVPFFFKQWGGVRRSTAGRILDGRIWHEMPPRSVLQPNPNLRRMELSSCPSATN